MTQTDDALKPCPFCGGRGHIAKDPDLNHGDFYFVKCAKCRSKSAEFHANETCPIFYAQVRDAWNRRADLAPQPDPLADPRVAALVDAAGELSSIIEGVQGAFNHGTWRDEKNGMRLKDTSEWVALYVALAAFNITYKPQGVNNEVKGGKDE